MRDATAQRWRWLPRLGSPGYHVLLAVVGLFFLGPLTAVVAAYMNLRLGFFIPGQVLAGILGSVVTFGYGPEGKHGANYMQTLAATISGMAGMCVLVQAMTWLGMPLPPTWQLVTFLACTAAFGIGVGMLYTPLLVDRLRLEYPSGHAVANILRALTDRQLLRRSILKLGGGTALGAGLGAIAEKVAFLAPARISPSTFGVGMVVGSRIAVPAALYGAIGSLLEGPLRADGWLGPKDPFRKITFLAALAMILGAAAVQLSLLAVEMVRRVRADRRRDGNAEAAVDGAGAGTTDRRGGAVSTTGLLVWCAASATVLVLVTHFLLGQPVGWVLLAIGLTVVFVCINGISQGITDSNPVSAAFVMSVLIMSALGLAEPVVALMAAAILFLACGSGVDMQQDRSTGWRLGTSRKNQFRYQVLGVGMGAVLCVGLAHFFMRQYPVLAIDAYANPNANASAWQSAMTFKLVGSIREIGKLDPHKVASLLFGLALGAGTEIARRLLGRSRRYRAYVKSGRTGFAVGWTVESLLLPSAYASSFGWFVDLQTSLWFAAGGVLTSVIATSAARAGARARAPAAGAGDALPEDMSTTSLVGGGLIAGESLFVLALGLWSLLTLL
jgi:uncharacterized oligopeptide transporter (OPT) family protein